MGWIKGVEPLTSRATIWRSNQLSYIHHMARLKRFELLTYCLEGSCSIQLSYRRKQVLERVMGIEPTQSAWKADILPLNYTRKIPSQPLYGRSNSTDLHIISASHSFVNTFFYILMKKEYFYR